MISLRIIIVGATLAGVPVGASAQVPLCLRVDTGKMVPCYSAEKVDAALAILKHQGSKADRDFVVSIEMNRGTFPDAKTLTDAVTGRLP